MRGTPLKQPLSEFVDVGFELGIFVESHLGVNRLRDLSADASIVAFREQDVFLLALGGHRCSQSTTSRAITSAAAKNRDPCVVSMGRHGSVREARRSRIRRRTTSP